MSDMMDMGDPDVQAMLEADKEEALLRLRAPKTVGVVVELTAPGNWDDYDVKHELMDVVNVVTEDTALVIKDVFVLHGVPVRPHRKTPRELRAIYEKHQPTRLVDMPELNGEEES